MILGNNASLLFDDFISVQNRPYTLETNSKEVLVNKSAESEINKSLTGNMSAEGKINYLLSEKGESIIKQEEKALNEFICSLSSAIPIQKEMSKLSIKQLSILLPFTYVESAHKLNPLIAYNTPDEGSKETTLDDNVAMIKAYGLFLSDLNVILNGQENRSAKETLLATSIMKIFGMLLYGDAKSQDYMGKTTVISFITDINSLANKDTFRSELVMDDFFKNAMIENVNLNRDTTYTLHIKTFKTDISLYFINHDNVKFTSYTSRKMKRNIVEVLSAELLESYRTKNLLNIFKVTSDFMYTHMLPNANGRASQVMRDCFALMLNESPFIALTNLSHYMYINSMPQDEHLKFMQTLFTKRLNSIKSGDFEDLIGDAQINELISSSLASEGLKNDLSYYRSLIKKNSEFTPQSKSDLSFNK